jgi:hypothetical protein
MYCPCGNSDGDTEWFYVDSWRQPPLTGTLAEEFSALKRDTGVDITHLPVTQLQYEEGSCGVVALMKAFAIAHMIHVVHQPEYELTVFFDHLWPRTFLEQSTAHYVGLCKVMGIDDVDDLTMFSESELAEHGFKLEEAQGVLKQASDSKARGSKHGVRLRKMQREAVHAVAQGMDKDGNKDIHWLEKNACFAKLAHRMIRIHEVEKFELYQARHHDYWIDPSI